MQGFSNDQIKELLETINFQHIAFIATHVGVEYLSTAERKQIKDIGLDVDKMTPIEVAFRFGQLTQALKSEKAKKVTYVQFKKHIAKGQYFPLTRREQESLDYCKRRAYSHIKGLGNKIDQQTGHLLIEVDRKQRKRFEKVLANTMTKATANRSTVTEIVSELGHKTGDWSRDFGRIAETESAFAFNSGRAMELVREFGEDVEVYVDVFENACKYCAGKYLTAGPGSEPIVFKLSDMLDFGTNVGKKVDQWQAVIPPMHPWCRCMLNYKDPMMDWDEETNSFNKPKPYARKVKRRSRVKITVGDKKYIV